MNARQRDLMHTAAAALAVTAVVLVLVLASHLRDDVVQRADAGEQVPLDSQPYGREAVVELPGAEVTTQISPPVTSLEHGVVSYDYDEGVFDSSQPSVDFDAPLSAPAGGVLVPVSWRVLDQGGIYRTKADPHPISIDLVAAGERTELDTVTLDDALSAADEHTVAVALGADVDVSDLSLEITYDGVTQSVSAADGSIDAGAAAVLYESRPSYPSRCAEVEDDCALTATDPDSPVRPSRAGFITPGVSRYVYDDRLGWADDGTLWASAYVQLFGADDVENAAGRYWIPRSKDLTVTLDGLEPVRDDLGSSLSATGYVVFQVDADAELSQLRIDQVLSLPRSAPQSTLPISARVPLDAVGS